MPPLRFVAVIELPLTVSEPAATPSGKSTAELLELTMLEVALMLMFDFTITCPVPDGFNSMLAVPVVFKIRFWLGSELTMTFCELSV